MKDLSFKQINEIHEACIEQLNSAEWDSRTANEVALIILGEEYFKELFEKEEEEEEEPINLDDFSHDDLGEYLGIPRDERLNYDRQELLEMAKEENN